MSPRNPAKPPKTASAQRSPKQSELIVKDHKSKQRSAQERSALDDRFHRTDPPFSRAAPLRRDATARHGRGSERRSVGCNG